MTMQFFDWQEEIESGTGEFKGSFALTFGHGVAGFVPSRHAHIYGTDYKLLCQPAAMLGPGFLEVIIEAFRIAEPSFGGNGNITMNYGQNATVNWFGPVISIRRGPAIKRESDDVLGSGTLSQALGTVAGKIHHSPTKEDQEDQHEQQAHDEIHKASKKAKEAKDKAAKLKNDLEAAKSERTRIGNDDSKNEHDYAAAVKKEKDLEQKHKAAQEESDKADKSVADAKEKTAAAQAEKAKEKLKESEAKLKEADDKANKAFAKKSEAEDEEEEAQNEQAEAESNAETLQKTFDQEKANLKKVSSDPNSTPAEKQEAEDRLKASGRRYAQAKEEADKAKADAKKATEKADEARKQSDAANKEVDDAIARTKAEESRAKEAEKTAKRLKEKEEADKKKEEEEKKTQDDVDKAKKHAEDKKKEADDAKNHARDAQHAANDSMGDYQKAGKEEDQARQAHKKALGAKPRNEDECDRTGKDLDKAMDKTAKAKETFDAHQRLADDAHHEAKHKEEEAHHATEDASAKQHKAFKVHLPPNLTSGAQQAIDKAVAIVDTVLGYLLCALGAAADISIKASYQTYSTNFPDEANLNSSDHELKEIQELYDMTSKTLVPVISEVILQLEQTVLLIDQGIGLVRDIAEFLASLTAAAESYRTWWNRAKTAAELIIETVFLAEQVGYTVEMITEMIDGLKDAFKSGGLASKLGSAFKSS